MVQKRARARFAAVLAAAAAALLAVSAAAPHHARALRSTRKLVNGVPLQSENDCEVDELGLENPILTASGTPAASSVDSPPNDLKVAFVGDMGVGSAAEAMAGFLKDEGADMLVYAGGMGTDVGEPNEFRNILFSHFSHTKPVVAALAREDFQNWSPEEAIEEVGKFSDAMGTCSGIHGVRQVCTHSGVTVVAVAPGAFGCQHARFVRESFAKHPSMWRVCVFHETQNRMQMSDHPDAAGWDVYEACRQAGAIVVTGNNRAYGRTHELSDMTRQAIVSSDPERPIELRPEGKGRAGTTFAAVVGTGGLPLETFRDGGNHDRSHWAAALSVSPVTDPKLKHGALFCTLGAHGSPRTGECYFKEMDGGAVRDEFTLVSEVDREDGEQELRLQVASKSDNAFQRVVTSTCEFDDATGVPLGVDPATDEAVLTALRFEHFPVDNETLAALGTSIVEAYIEFVPLGPAPSAPGTLHVSAVDADTTASPCGTDYASNGGRLGPVDWPAWSAADAAAGVVRTPDIKELLEQILARPGFAANNAVTLLVSGDAERSVAAFDQDHGCCEAPVLVVRLAPHLHVEGTALDTHGAVQVNCGPPGECSCNPALRAAPRFVSGSPGPVSVATPTPANYTVAFLANNGVGAHPTEVLEAVRDAGADLIVNAGNLLGHTRGAHTIEEWRAQVAAAGLGSVPLFWTPGPNDVDEDGEPAAIAAALYDDMAALGTCHGAVGENTVCTRPGMTVALVAPDVAGCDHAEYVEWAFAAYPSMWRVCAFYQTAAIFDVGHDSPREDLLPVYEACRRAGALVVTGGSNTYARSYTMSSMEAPGTPLNIDPARALVLSEEVQGESPDTSKAGTSAILAVGLGGESVGNYDAVLTHKRSFWARTLASPDTTQAATGAVICQFGYHGMEDLARCERVTRRGDVTDQFWLRTTAGELPIDWQVRVQVHATVDDVEQIEVMSDSGEVTAQRCGSRDLEIVDDIPSEAEHQIVGLRFTDFPLSATVLDVLRTNTESAWIEFTAYGTNNDHAQDLFVNIHGDRNWNSTELCNTDIRMRDWTDNATEWRETQLWDVSYEMHRSPDLLPVINEMLETPRWTAGGAASIYIVGNGTRSAASYDLNCCVAPILVVQLGPHNVDFIAHDPIFYYNATGFDDDFPEGNSGGGGGSGHTGLGSATASPSASATATATATVTATATATGTCSALNVSVNSTCSGTGTASGSDEHDGASNGTNTGNSTGTATATGTGTATATATATGTGTAAGGGGCGGSGGGSDSGGGDDDDDDDGDHDDGGTGGGGGNGGLPDSVNVPILARVWVRANIANTEERRGSLCASLLAAFARTTGAAPGRFECDGVSSEGVALFRVSVVVLPGEPTSSVLFWELVSAAQNGTLDTAAGSDPFSLETGRSGVNGAFDEPDSAAAYGECSDGSWTLACGSGGGKDSGSGGLSGAAVAAVVAGVVAGLLLGMLAAFLVMKARQRPADRLGGRAGPAAARARHANASAGGLGPVEGSPAAAAEEVEMKYADEEGFGGRYGGETGAGGAAELASAPAMEDDLEPGALPEAEPGAQPPRPATRAPPSAPAAQY